LPFDGGVSEIADETILEFAQKGLEDIRILNSAIAKFSR
jgi:hypothetical protein